MTRRGFLAGAAAAVAVAQDRPRAPGTTGIGDASHRGPDAVKIGLFRQFYERMRSRSYYDVEKAQAEPVVVTKGPAAAVSYGPASPVGNFAAAHICASIPNSLILEFAMVKGLGAPILSNSPSNSEMGLTLSERPGLGITLSERMVAQHKLQL